MQNKIPWLKHKTFICIQSATETQRKSTEEKKRTLGFGKLTIVKDAMTTLTYTSTKIVIYGLDKGKNKPRSFPTKPVTYITAKSVAQV